MKKYIKPNINVLVADASTIMEGSISDNGNKGDLGHNGGPSGASGGRSKHHTFDSLWDETWDTNDEDANE